MLKNCRVSVRGSFGVMTIYMLEQSFTSALNKSQLMMGRQKGKAREARGVKGTQDVFKQSSMCLL